MSFNPSQNNIFDFHTLRGSKSQMIDLIKSLTKTAKSNKEILKLENKYKNSGFALVYNTNIGDIKKTFKDKQIIFNKRCSRNT